MTRDDWTLIAVRVLGLYLIGTQLGAFITSVSTLIIVVTRDPNLQNMPVSAWQAPVITTIVLVAGIVFVTKSRSIATWLQKSDKK
jgi:hypothetical protein